MTKANPTNSTRPLGALASWRMRHVLILSALVVAVVTASIGCGGSDEPVVTAAPSTFPEPSLVDLRTGDEVALDRYRGTPVIVNLWATWCTPCRTEMPELEAAQQRYGDRIQIVGITDAADQAASLAAASAIGVTYPLLVDTDERLQIDLGVTGLPATAFLDGDGHLLELHAGVLDTASLDETIGRLYGIS
jgi:cytochrome c biogenesis protein CcmG/thiol:disulfide interchange protein DsbE